MNENVSREAAEIRKHVNMVEKGSILDIIQEKESAINMKVLETKKKAEDIIADARVKAVQIKEKAEKEGPKEARAFFDSEIAKAKKEAEKITASIEVEVKAITAGGMKNFDRAVQKVEELVIP